MTKIQSTTTSFEIVEEVMEIPHEKYPQCQKNQPLCSIMIFTQRQKIDLKDAEISKETRQKLLTLQHNYDEIVSKYSSDIRLTHLEEMTNDTDPKFALL